MRTLFSTVLNMSLTASFVILAVLAVRFLLRKAPRRFSYALWAVVLFRLLCPIALESPLSLIPTSQPLAAVEQAVRPDKSGTTTVPNGASTVPNVPYTPAAPAAEPAAANPAPALTVPSSGSAAVSNSTQTAAPAPAAVTVDPVTIAAAVWLCGAGALAAYSAVSLLRLRRRLVGAVPEADGVWLADHISTPFVLGLARPRIYLPSTLPGSEREYILLHERTHIRRGDHIVKALAFAALAVHWFNPLVWLAFHLAGRDMEMSCDEAVLRHMDRDVRADYSSSLLRLSAGRRLPVGPLAFGDGDPQSRIKNVMNYKKPAFWVVALAVVAVAACCVALFTNPAHRSEPGGRDEELTFTMHPDYPCLIIGGSHRPELLRWYFPSDTSSDLAALRLGNLFINDLPMSGGTSKMGTAFWTSDKRNAIKFNLLQFGEQNVTVNFTVALSGTGGSIIEQEVWQHPEIDFPLSDDEAIALAQDYAYYIREAEAHYASGDYAPAYDLSDLSADLKFTPSDDGEDQLLPNIRITGTFNGQKIGCDSFSGDRILWYPYEYGDRYPLGQLFFPQCASGSGGKDALCATWTNENHTAIRLDNSFLAMISALHDQKWYDVTVTLFQEGGVVTERNAHGSGGTVTKLSDEEAIALARFAAKLLTAAEDYYNGSGLDWSDRYQEFLDSINSQQSILDQWEETLAPYTPFGLTWEFSDPDGDGNGLTMYFQDQVVRGIVDEEKGLWITEHTGSNFPEGAVEVFAIRQDGKLTGLRIATPEEQSQYDLMRQENSRQGEQNEFTGKLTLTENGGQILVTGLDCGHMEWFGNGTLYFTSPAFLHTFFRKQSAECEAGWTDDNHDSIYLQINFHYDTGDPDAQGEWAGAKLDYLANLETGEVTVRSFSPGVKDEGNPFTLQEMQDMARTMAQVLTEVERCWYDDGICSLPLAPYDGSLPFTQRVTMEFCSGAGGWATVLHLDPDGHFEGEYYDSDMGVTGSGYPNGTMYLCNFYGQFEVITQLSDNSWSLTLKELVLNTGLPIGEDFHPVGEEWTSGGVRYISSEPYGLDGRDGKALAPGAQFILYSPNAKGYAPGDELYGMHGDTDDYDSPMYQFWGWWPYKRAWAPGSTLGCWGLLNQAYGQGFFSENVFSWETDKTAHAGQPGVKLNGFVHTEPPEYGLEWGWEWVLDEVTVDYDWSYRYVDPDAQMFRYDFGKNGMAGGGQSVYLDYSGVTQMIVYGE